MWNVRVGADEKFEKVTKLTDLIFIFEEQQLVFYVRTCSLALSHGFRDEPRYLYIQRCSGTRIVQWKTCAISNRTTRIAEDRNVSAGHTTTNVGCSFAQSRRQRFCDCHLRGPDCVWRCVLKGGKSRVIESQLLQP